MSTTRALLVLVVAAGCGGRYPGPAAPTGRPAPEKAAMPKGGIESAALPYVVLDGRTGRQLDEAAFWPRLAQARAVCIGEEHPNPHHHWVQLHAVRRLVAARKDEALALGLEMIQRPFQGVLDDYAAKRIDADALKSRTGWEERWGYDFGFYGPTLDVALAAGAKLLALNASRELTKKVSRQGLESLTPDERAQVPELKLDDVRHRAWFDGLMNEMGGAHAHGRRAEDKDEAGDPHGEPAGKPDRSDKAGKPAMPSAERIYTVQVLWDETMADLGARWLAANPRGRLIILAGNGHCHDSAIVGRLKRRGTTDVLSVRPVIDLEGNVAEVLAKPMNDYVFVLQMPK
ncbi:MAG TPA: ChaN family lipoprotein [Kofleriaceae bacterium]|nr:ChaN family lipoprotein [Kofleriaceae bacterium]